MSQKQAILDDLLEGFEVPEFPLMLIEKSRTDTDSIMEVYNFLKEKGFDDKRIKANSRLFSKDLGKIKDNYGFLKKIRLSDEKIVSQANLLGRSSDTIIKNHKKLKEIGLSDEKIATYAQLLGMKPETIQENYNLLIELGLNKNKIISQANLLGRNTKTLKKNREKLKEIGLSDKKIATYAQLLNFDIKTLKGKKKELQDLGFSKEYIVSHPILLVRNTNSLKKNYQKQIGLLSESYENRKSGKDLLLSSSLLTISTNTIEANVQYLKHINIYNEIDDTAKIILLGTKPQTKRKKIAWILREVFDYRDKYGVIKKETISNMYRFIKENPKVLIPSISKLENNVDKLKEKSYNYFS